MRRLLSAGALLAALALAVSACGSSHAKAGPPTRVSSSRLIENGNFRITATAETPAQPGKRLRVTFGVTNVSNRARSIQLGYPENLWFKAGIPNSPGYDSRYLSGMSVGGPASATKIKPGKSVTRTLSDLPVSWSGPLQITPGFNGTALQTLTVPVAVPTGRPPSNGAAMAEVVASTGHLLDNCRPTRPGVAVSGEIKAPRNSAPPMSARCSISLQHEHGFVRAQVFVTIPAGHRAHVQEPYEFIHYPKPKWNNTEAIAWLFVVTHKGAISTNAFNMTAARHVRQRLQDVKRGSVYAECGTIGPMGGDSSGPTVDFVTLCR
ncbi:MAG TPA: hypothetical protein VGH79_04955 [Gaiellaceae bacterium]|jgi:hypothetical protein